MQEIPTEGVPIRVWGGPHDDSTLEQARHLALLPFAFRHVALMADAHVGYGMPIGGVLATRDAVIPHAVGLDIGCGVRAWPIGVDLGRLLAERDAILHEVQRAVPTGFHWHDESQAARTRLFERLPALEVLEREAEKATRQVGTLGGGNHFIELQVDDDEIVWAMVHSGSRNLGKQVAEHYDGIARERCDRDGCPVPAAWQLAHLPIGSAHGAEYLEAMRFCLSFARDSRRLMAERVQEAVLGAVPEAVAGETIDVHHNYAALETHFGEEVVVHRKGAVRAEGTVVIPGSMGTHSYIGHGLASAESFISCSHGAGRAMGRKQALRSIPAHRVLAEMAERDIRLFKPKKGDVAEEAAEAYKDIDDVMTAQADLVEPIARLRPLGVVKA